MKELVNFEGEWGIEQIKVLIELRFKHFKEMSADEEWEDFTQEWNQMQAYEVFTTDQIKEKLTSLEKEYKEIQIVLEGMEEQDIDLPPYWTKMVEFMPLSLENLPLKRKSDHGKRKNTKKSKMPLMETFDGGFKNIISVKDQKENYRQSDQEQDLDLKRKQDGLEKIATAIENFGNIIKTEATSTHSKFENILLNQQKLLEVALEQIGKQLSERIDSGMNQILDVLRTADHEE